jgi:hypothetical protein
MYEGESNENLKIFIFFISQFIEHKRYTMTSFFYVVSIAFHTNVPALQKCMDTSRKNFFWPDRSHLCTACYTSSSYLKDFMNFLVHSYTCCSDRHASPYWTFIHRLILMGFTPSLLKNTLRTLFVFGECRKRGRHIYTTTAPSCRIAASYCDLSASLQTISITVVNLQNNWAAFRIFIALLRFSFDSPSYIWLQMMIKFIQVFQN